MGEVLRAMVLPGESHVSRGNVPRIALLLLWFGIRNLRFHGEADAMSDCGPKCPACHTEQVEKDAARVDTILVVILAVVTIALVGWAGRPF